MCCCSTLDPVLRMEQKGINPEGVGLIALALAYLTATPGTSAVCNGDTDLAATFQYTLVMLL